ncbi:calmodulin, putative [Babesia caballi]|uniref:Calmodulin, putative n=1 Tax=Babesia caballi TaxID=5871 RepID=A0AAV4LM09_BABCB|nr:calmodulin, putative [Babesia caballi]
MLIAQLQYFDGAGISQRIRVGLCSSGFTQDWAGSVCSGDGDGEDMDSYVHFSGVSFFDDGGATTATLVKTAQTPEGPVVERMSSVAEAARELITMCQRWWKARRGFLKTRSQSVAMLRDLCTTLGAHLSRNIADKSGFSGSADVWDMVHVLLSNISTMKGVATTRFLSRLELAPDVAHGSLEEKRWEEHIRRVMDPVVSYMEQNVPHLSPVERVTTEQLIAMSSPLSHVALMALPELSTPELGIAEDTVLRLFTTFPEAASMFVFAVERKIVRYPQLSARTRVDRLALLAVFIANLQVMVTTTFDDISEFARIAGEEGVNWELKEPLDRFWELFAYDRRSRVYLMNLFSRAGRTEVDGAFHRVMAYNVDMAAKVTAQVVADHGVHVSTPLARSKLIENVVFHMVQMCKFVTVDTDNTGQLQLHEFVSSLMGEREARQFREHVSELWDEQGRLAVYYDFNFVNGRAKMVKRHHRKTLEGMNAKYNEVLDTFMIADADGSGEVSLEEFFQHAYATSPLATTVVGDWPSPVHGPEGHGDTDHQ